MKIATWNVNSIRVRLPRVLAFLARHEPAALCLQETKVVDGDFPYDAFRAVGYEVAHHGQKTYNGVAIVARTMPEAVVRGLDDGVDDPQARLIAGTVDGIRVVSAYVPNGQAPDSEKYAYKLEWLARLRRHLEARYRDTEALLVSGDFNVAPEAIDVHDPAAWVGQILCTDKERAALRHVIDFGLIDLYRSLHPEGGRFTWWDYRQLAFPKNLGLRIDHLFVTPSLAARCIDAEIDREERKGKQASDHAPVLARFR